MARDPDESMRKKNFSLTLNPELVLELQNDCGIQNLSGWVNEQMRQHVLDRKIIFKCTCGCTASIGTWQKWLLICPMCKTDHARLDRRERIKLEG